MLDAVFDFTYTCRGCDNRFSLLVGDPKTELCPQCCRGVREVLTAEFSASIIEEIGCENAEIHASVGPPRSPDADRSQAHSKSTPIRGGRSVTSDPDRRPGSLAAADRPAPE